MAVLSSVADSHKRPCSTFAFSADCFFLDHSDKKLRGFHEPHFPSSGACACASSFLACNTECADTADSSTGSSCCSSLPSYGSSCTEQAFYCISGEDEAESCCGGDEAESCCGGDGDMDISAFFYEDENDDEKNESLSFNPETIFLNDTAGSTDFSSDECQLIGCSSDENGSWFLNELDSHGQAFLNEVLDQEWMAAAVANLEKLNDTLRADSCVLHLFESDQASENHH